MVAVDLRRGEEIGLLQRHDMADPPLARVEGEQTRIHSTQAGDLIASDAVDGAANLNQDGPSASTGAPAMQGLVTLTADGAKFLDCESGETFPVAVDGDFPALEHAYLAAGNEPGVSVFAKFDGEIRENHAGEADGTNAVLVSRFIGIWPDASCERASGDVSLTNTYWKITSLYGTEIIAPEGGKEPHLILLGAESRFTATVGCNQFMGTYDLRGNGISFGPGAASTRMACPEPLSQWETLLGQAIAGAARWTLSGDTLQFQDAEGEPTVTFVAVSLN